MFCTGLVCHCAPGVGLASRLVAACVVCTLRHENVAKHPSSDHRPGGAVSDVVDLSLEIMLEGGLLCRLRSLRTRMPSSARAEGV